MQAGVNQLNEKVDLLLARLRLAAVADKRVERRRRVFGVLTIVVILASVGACNLIVDVLPLSFPFKMLALAGLVALIVLVARWWVVARRQDLDDRKLNTVGKALSILRADIPRDVPVGLTVDLRGYKAGGTIAGRKGNVTLYRHQWLTLSVPLADGNTITLAITDRVKRKAKRKRTAEQFRTDVDLGLRLNKRYDDAAEIVRRLRRVAAPKPFGAMTVSEGRKTDGRQKRLWARLSTPLAVNSSGLVGGDGLLAAVRWTYAGLAPPRAG